MADLIRLVALKKQNLVCVGNDRAGLIVAYKASRAWEDNLMTEGAFFVAVFGMRSLAAEILDTEKVALEENMQGMIAHKTDRLKQQAKGTSLSRANEKIETAFI
jgi:hypothetical protein